MHLTIDEFRRLGYRAVDIAAEHLAQVPSGLVYRQMKAEDRARLMDLPLPNRQSPPDQLLDSIQREILAYPLQTEGRGAAIRDARSLSRCLAR